MSQSSIDMLTPLTLTLSRQGRGDNLRVPSPSTGEGKGGGGVSRQIVQIIMRWLA